MRPAGEVGQEKGVIACANILKPAAVSQCDHLEEFSICREDSQFKFYLHGKESTFLSSLPDDG